MAAVSCAAEAEPVAEQPDTPESLHKRFHRAPCRRPIRKKNSGRLRGKYAVIGGAVRKKQTRCERFLTLSVHILNLQFEEQCVLVCYMMTKTGDGISMLKKK